MYNSISNKELRYMARNQLSGRWGTAVLTCFLMQVVLSVLAFIPYLGGIASFFIAGPVSVGLAMFFLSLVRGGELRIETAFQGFRYFVKSFVVYFLMGLFVLLWSLLLIIPGIIAAFAYSQVFYIICDNPEMGAMDVLRTSKAMMKGYKMKLFLLNLSFIGWGILCIFTLFIGYLWLGPYIQASVTNFYEDVKASYIESSANYTA